jgi:hypothetical protein
VTALEPVTFKKGRGHAPRLSKPYVPGKRHPRFWTAAESAVLRRHFETGGAARCKQDLPHRALGSIYQQAGKLGLHGKHFKKGAPRSRALTPALERQIREAWPTLKGRGAVAALADRLDVPRWKVSKFAAREGLALPHKKEPPWKAAELELMKRVPLHSPDLCARIFREHGFRRTATAIVVKAKRLDLKRRYSETLSATGAARILGIDNKTAACMCIDGRIKASRRGTKRLPQQGGDAWSIERADLRRYILENLETLDIRKVEKFSFVALLAGEG